LNDAEMRAYLLGQATGADAARFEEQLLEDEQIYTTLRSVEDDLFDEFARGALTDAERALFLERHGADRGRLLMAQALARRSRLARHSGEAPSTGLPLRSAASAKAGFWVPLAAAATLAAAVGATMWLRPRPADVPPTIRSVAAPPSIAPAVLLVTLGTSRSAAATPVAGLRNGTSVLELHVRLDPSDRFDRYSMELRNGSGLAWHDEELHASPGSGEPIIVATVPAASLEPGSYELAVRGVNGASPPEALGFVTVKVERIP
jgi:hypothetical protein